MAASLTEQAAALAFARAWNRLDPDGFVALLAPDARYCSQMVAAETETATAIGTLLREQMDHSVRTKIQVRAELGITTEGWPDRHCVILRPLQNQVMSVGAVLFTLAHDRVSRCDVFLPELLNARGIGVFPI